MITIINYYGRKTIDKRIILSKYKTHPQLHMIFFPVSKYFRKFIYKYNVLNTKSIFVKRLTVYKSAIPMSLSM